MTKINPTSELLRTLQEFDSPTISNVIEVFDVRPRSGGYMNATMTALFPEFPPIVGYVSTAAYRSARPAAQGETYSSLLAHVEALTNLPSPRVVVLEDLDQPPAAASFGEVMCATYQRFGCVGIITSGAARDLAAVRGLGFAAFAASVCVSHGYGRIEDIHQPVHVGGITLRPGDLIHADANGIVTIPLEIAQEVARACPHYLEAESLVLDYLKGDDVTLDGLREAFERLAARINGITETSKRIKSGLV